FDAGGAGGDICTSGGEALLSLKNRVGALRDAVRYLASIPGRRKSLFLISEGLGVSAYQVVDQGGDQCSSLGDEMHQAIEVATRSSIAMYPVDPRGLGLDAGVDLTAESAMSTDDATTARADAMSQRDSLRALGDLTGGFAIQNTNNFDALFTRVVREN